MSPEFIYQLLATLAGVAAVYGGIRADLKSMRESLTRAHVRIDDHIAEHWSRKA